MKKYYAVIIKGRTLESRNIKELLAKAVSEKRKAERPILLESCAPIHWVGHETEIFESSRF
jgi:hypothetical protein